MTLYIELRFCSASGHCCSYSPSDRWWNRIGNAASFGRPHNARRDRHPAPFSFLSCPPYQVSLTELAVVLILYAALAAEFLLRFNLDRPMQRIRDDGVILPRGAMERPIRLMLIGLSAMLVLLLTRSIYRLIELSDGWTGKVISTQWLFGLFPRLVHS
jgi:hypothetical protein